MTNDQILQIAMAQSAVDLGCKPDDFHREENLTVISREHPNARRYLKLPFSCNLVSYGGNIVASVSEPYREAVQKYIDAFPNEHCFETPNLHVLNRSLEAYGEKLCFMAEYFLPDVSRLKELPCAYEVRVLNQKNLAKLYLPQWSNALCKHRKHLDMIGVGAYDNGALVGLAGASADCDTMWQIGIDVLPAYRHQGIASALTSRIALEILGKGIVPFYCAAWSNIASVRNAIRSGFRPAWVELTAKPIAMVDEMNQNLIL